MRTFLLSLICFFAVAKTYAQMAITSEHFDRVQQQQFGQSALHVQNSYEVLAIAVDATIKDQIAEVSVTQTIYNPGNRALEVEIFFPLPNGGIVQNFMMMVNGQEIPGQLMKQEEARGIYEEIVRRKRDPALMEYAGYGLFKTSVFPIQVGEERTITVRYTQVCDRHMNNISFVYPFGTQKFSAKALRSVSLNARIESSEAIKSIFSPTDDIVVKRNGEKGAVIKMEKSYVLPTSDFKMVFATNNSEVGASLLSYKASSEKEGYFMLMASPSVEETQKQSAKNVVFVLDRSGSMTGQKIEQSKKAMEFVLRNLNEGDLFNIVAYDDRVEKYKEEMQTYNKATFDEAYTYVNTLAPGGGTNINGALVSAMESLPDNKRPTYVIFLTDGLPTAGTTDEMSIATNCTNANKIKARLFAFGVGNDVNARLLDRLSTGNGGLSEYVKPGEDIEASVAKLFSNISSPVLTDIRISFDGMDVRSTYPEVLPDMFRGGQILWVGKYTKPGKSIVTIKGKNNGVEKVYTFPVEFVSHTGTKAHDYLEKIWASRRIGYLINQIDLNGKNPELIDELVKLSKEFGILTPYTAFLAREDVNLNAVSDNLRQTEENLKELEVVRGETANEQRAYKQSMQNNSSVSGTDMAYNNSGSSAQQGTQNAPVNVNQNVKNVGSKTFYNKNDNWVDGSASAADEKNAKRVQFNSSEYFALAKGQPAEFNQYLSVGENVLVVVNGVAYQIYR